jgi:L-serine dehydratase
MGPMLAAVRFLNLLRDKNLTTPISITVTLYGSLAFTGKGHSTDKAIILGLMGFVPDTLDATKAKTKREALEQTNIIEAEGLPIIHFDPKAHLIFNYDGPLEGHPNGMIFNALDEDGAEICSETIYSIGGGFILSEDELNNRAEGDEPKTNVPYAFKNAVEMLAMSEQSGLSIGEMKRENERTLNNDAEIDAKLDKIWDVMNNCIERGLARDGILPGGLDVKRRAKDIAEQLRIEELKNSKSHHVCNEWLSLYAMAVNEENAAGGQVVTAPTNGAAGVIPAVIRYYLDFVQGANKAGVRDFLLTAAAVGGIIKHNASISGAEVGCQGEVGSAAAMAAAGLCAVMGGDAKQIENAAEIALEHHLGMTCDPAAGLVQVPCIERNGLGAVKAVTAAALALRGDGSHIIPLDNCIETMRQTGADMSERYKETSQGGLAVNLPEC